MRLAQDLQAGDHITAGTVEGITLRGNSVIIRLAGGTVLLAHYSMEVN